VNRKVTVPEGAATAHNSRIWPSHALGTPTGPGTRPARAGAGQPATQAIA